jgi:hypothetical protein
VHFDGGWQTE